MPKLLKIYLFCTILKFCHIYFRSCQTCHFWCPMCIPWIIKILLTTNLQQKSPCPPCIPWITKISGSPTYKKKRRYSHTTSSAQKNPYLIYFCSCKYTNKTDTLQIFPYIFLFLFVKIKLFLPQATKKNPRNTRRTQILVKDSSKDFR